jgi:hypothetical protein
MLKMTQQNEGRKKMLIEKTSQGAWCISSVVNGQLITMVYFCYTKTEAKEEFKNDQQRENPKTKG